MVASKTIGVRFGILAHHRRHWLVKKRQVVVCDVHEFALGVATPLRDFINPFGYGLAGAAGSCTADDDGHCKHTFLLCGSHNRFDACVRVVVTGHSLLNLAPFLGIFSGLPFLKFRP
jgi:hypothetical protein